MQDTIFLGLTFNVQTFGCQMNKHDSERIAGVMLERGASEVDSIDEADMVIFMTCCVRESAETRLLGHVNSLKNLPTRKDSPIDRRLIAVGGCMGQRDGETLQKRVPHIDVVFGTMNIDELPVLLEESLERHRFTAHTRTETQDFSSDLATRRENPWSAWLPITVGCDNFCTYCIVPYVRGREHSRTLEDITQEASLLVADGVKEITLLGQNVNSYGRDIYGSPRFAEALDAVASTGIERLRFATSHPKDLTDDVIERFATLDALMPALHLPVQSGSNNVLSKMNRVYTSEHYLGLIDKLRKACPNIALSTDVIVGFPGETEDDFQATCDLIERVGYNQVFTFLFSPRTGTPAANFEGSVPREIMQERFDRLFAIVEKGAYHENCKDAGKTVRVLVEGPSKRDESVLTGRSERNLNVHAPIPSGQKIENMTGTIVEVRVTEPRTWYLYGEVV